LLAASPEDYPYRKLSRLAQGLLGGGPARLKFDLLFAFVFVMRQKITFSNRCAQKTTV
jgi:hypothetical protein